MLVWLLGDCYTLNLMIRPFNLRDLPLVHRLSELGVSLHTESALTKNLHPTRGALFSLVGGDFPTYVWKSDKNGLAGFIQLCLDEESIHAHILYLSSTGEGQIAGDPNTKAVSNDEAVNGERPYQVIEDAWLPLLDQAVIEAGQRGIHSLVAEVDEASEELPVLRRAGFVVYTRQDVWILTNGEVESVKAKEGKNILRPRQAEDDWDIQLLYANTVPRLVQLVEPMPPLHDGAGWVLHEDNELAAFVHVHVGPVATWMRLFIHPSAEAQVDQIITAVVQQMPATRPIYCCVRRYQSWVQNALQRSGFTLWGSQAVMVKHIVQKATRPLTDLSAALEAQGITPTAPLIRQYQKNKEHKGARVAPSTPKPILEKS